MKSDTGHEAFSETRGKCPSSRDVARLAGVSQATVSHVINGGSGRLRVSTETRERVMQAISELGYQPNAAARALRTQRTQLVALLTPDLLNPFYPLLAQGVQEVLGSHDFELLIANSGGQAGLERRFLETVVRRGVDGAIVVAWHLRREDIDAVLRHRLGFISVGIDYGHPQLSTISSRDHRAAGDMVRYLLRKGHRRIAHIAGDQSTPPGRVRLEGFRAAIAAAGISAGEASIVYGDFTRGSAGSHVRELMARDELPSAIFAANDTMAVEALLTVQELGFRVPEDVAIAGFDDTIEAELVRPALTTVHQPVLEMGRTAAEMLLERIEQPDAEVRRVFVQHELIIRGSA